MKNLSLALIFMITVSAFSQEEVKDTEKFLPVVIEGKEAFMSTKTGGFVYGSHKEMNPEELRTTASGIVYKEKSYHTVAKKETLASIAKEYHQTVDELKNNNDLKSSKLEVGQTLKIVNNKLLKSSSPVISYKGESRIIAKLRPGQSRSTFNPPPATSGSAQASKTSEAPSVTENKKEPVEGDNFHTVATGETLYSIAKKYNLTTQELKDLNNLTLNNLSIGQKLKVQ